MKHFPFSDFDIYDTFDIGCCWSLDIMASIDDKRMTDGGDKKEEEEFASGPFSVLLHSVKHNTQVNRRR